MLFGQLAIYLRERREELLYKLDQINADRVATGGSAEHMANLFRATVFDAFDLIEGELAATERDVLGTYGAGSTAERNASEAYR